MRKLTYPLFIIAFALILTLGILAYRYYIEPLYSQNVGIEKELILDSTKKELIIKKRLEQADVFSLELEINGSTKNNFGIRIMDSTQVIQDARVKGGKNSSFTYFGDWYSDSVILEFYPDKSESGKLNISCRFITL